MGHYTVAAGEKACQDGEAIISCAVVVARRFAREPPMLWLRTIDAHVAGAPSRLVVEGFPALRGPTLAARIEDARARCGRLRRLVMHEPRGHADLAGAVFTERERPEADAGVIFMDVSDFGALCGHAVMAAVTIGVERGLLAIEPDRRTVRLDTALGPIDVTFERRGSDGRVTRVAYSNPPASVLAPGLTLDIGRRQVAADIVRCGEAYAIVDAERAGVGLDVARAAELRRLGPEIARAAEAALQRRTPDGPPVAFAGTIFTGPSTAGDLRSATVYVDGALDRSPGGTPTGAVMAVLDEMGLLRDDRPFAHESLLGTTLRGRIVSRTGTAGGREVVTEIEGRAFVTGEHVFSLDPDDPLGEGYRL
jgi:proline racemase